MKQKLIAVLGVATVVLLFSCGNDHKAMNPANMPVPVNLYVVQAQPVVYYDEYPATATALSQVDIHAEVEGYVEGIFFKDGDHVKAGQKLYEIDRTQYQASYDQALANVKVAEGNLEQAKKDAERYEYLNKYDAIAKQVLDHAMITLQNSRNQVAAAKQDLIKAQTNLNYSIIKAPFTGTIGFSQVKLGNTVSIGTTVLNTISTDNPMAVDFVVNEKQLQRFIKIQQQGNTADSLFTLVLPGGDVYEYTGNIYAIDRGVDPQTGTVRIRVVFPNPKSELRAGMSLTLRVHNENSNPQLLIPTKSIVEQMGEYFVFAVKDTMMNTATDNTKKQAKQDQQAGPQLRAIQEKIITGQVVGPNTIIKEGLQAGDTIVTDGMQKLHDGSVITTANSSMGPGQGGSGGKGKADSSAGNTAH